MENNLKGEIALLLMLGAVGLKTAPYMAKFGEKFKVDKQTFIKLKKMNIYELLARYSFIDKIENERSENDGR